MVVPYYALSKRQQNALHAKRKRARNERALRSETAQESSSATVRQPAVSNKLKLLDDENLPRPDNFIHIPVGTALKAFTEKTANLHRIKEAATMWMGNARKADGSNHWAVLAILVLLDADTFAQILVPCKDRERYRASITDPQYLNHYRSGKFIPSRP